MIHLHVHTDGSTLDGASTVKRLITRAKELNMSALGITDHGNMIQTLAFQEECIKQNIKPIIGCEFYVGAPESKDTFHLVAIAKNNAGLKNLYALNTYSYVHNFYKKPRIKFDELVQHREGLIITTACLGSEFAQRYIDAEFVRLTAMLEHYKNCFEDFYVELQANSIPIQETYNKKIFEKAQLLNIPCIVTCDVHYAYESDFTAHDTMLAMQTKKKVSDNDRMKFTTNDFYLKSTDEVTDCLATQGFTAHQIASMIFTTENIANICDARIETGLRLLPVIADNEIMELGELCNIGFRRKQAEELLAGTPEEINRVRYELSVIRSSGYAGYFLIVQDYIEWAKNNNIYVGPGRGSAAGSLVAYIIGITNINPLKYGLLFERFLNPERLTMPDIDSDFDYEDRGKVIEYVRSKYGADKVAQICAKGTMGANAVCRKVLSAHEFEQRYINKICSEIPDKLGITLEEAYNLNPTFGMYMRKHLEQYEIMKTLEGVMSHTSKHAAGIAICSEIITDHVPCMSDTETRGDLVTQWDKYDLEKIGILKCDFLGLKTLTIIKKTIENIFETQGIQINLESINLDDTGIYEQINSGNLSGIFQFDAPTAKQVVGQIHPMCFDDIIAGVSIGRPGVKERDLYIRNKANGYIAPSRCCEDILLDSVLCDTYGAIVYQEQTLMLMHKFTGGAWSLGKCDKMRKVKNLEEYREDFIGCSTTAGFDIDFCNNLYSRFDLGYTFNKSHAAAYAVVGAETAWLKKYYYKEFMSALMTMELLGDADKLMEHIAECRKCGVKLLPPDINKSGKEFKPSIFRVVSNEQPAIRFPLTAIANVGDIAVNEIIHVRRNCEYFSFIDFIRRVPKKKVNKRIVVNLIKAGCFDFERADRNYLINEFTIERRENFIDLPMWSEQVQLAYEKEVLGTCISKHPMDGFSVVAFSDLPNECEVMGIINSVSITTDRNGNEMAFIKLENQYDLIEVVIFSHHYNSSMQYNERIFTLGIKVRIKGHKDGSKLIADGKMTFLI